MPIYCHGSEKDVNKRQGFRSSDHRSAKAEQTNERVWLMQQLENIGVTNLVSLKRHVSVKNYVSLHAMGIEHFMEQH